MFQVSDFEQMISAQTRQNPAVSVKGSPSRIDPPHKDRLLSVAHTDPLDQQARLARTEELLLGLQSEQELDQVVSEFLSTNKMGGVETDNAEGPLSMSAIGSDMTNDSVMPSVMPSLNQIAADVVGYLQSIFCDIMEVLQLAC